jgi:5'(3')-deoxyribonucleotidase
VNGPGFVLGVDLDGVCADYNTAFRAAVARHRGVDPSTLTTEVTWDFAEWGLDREGFLEHHRRAVVEDHVFAAMPAIDGVADALWRLSDAGVWIRIITHRLVSNWSHATVVSDTVNWLDEHRIPYRDLCFLGHKPQVEADAYVEDAPHNVEALRRSGNEVIVFDQPYNRGLPAPRARTWAEVEAIVGDLVAAATGAFESQLPGVDPGADRLERRRGAPG